MGLEQPRDGATLHAEASFPKRDDDSTSLKAVEPDNQYQQANNSWYCGTTKY